MWRKVSKRCWAALDNRHMTGTEHPQVRERDSRAFRACKSMEQFWRKFSHVEKSQAMHTEPCI